ncbi:MAG: short-chain dehydrogenase/reductase [Frankiales bacterium]|nr:short-chain dehydrogenase/reductase [Frankiales bacterium]
MSGPPDAGVLSGAVALVTGASRGIGLATSRLLAQQGATVVMVARDEAVLAEAAPQVGPAAVPLVGDVSRPDDVQRVFAEVEQRFGRLDVLVNNAGGASPSRLVEMTDEQVRAVVDLNLLAPLYTLRSAVPLMRSGGTVVCVSSESAASPFPQLGLYGASKAGLEALCRAAAQELAPQGIRVAVVVAGMTRTSWSRDWTPEAKAGFYADAVSGGHLAAVSGGDPMTPDDVARAVVFVASSPPGVVVDVLRVRAHGTTDPAERAARSVAAAFAVPRG